MVLARTFGLRRGPAHATLAGPTGRNQLLQAFLVEANDYLAVHRNDGNCQLTRDPV